jgi:hypothetical protein
MMTPATRDLACEIGARIACLDLLIYERVGHVEHALRPCETWHDQQLDEHSEILGDRARVYVAALCKTHDIR